MDKGQLGNQLSIFIYLFLFVLIGGGIVFGTSLFLEDSSDFRSSDAVSLNREIQNCIRDVSEADFSTRFYDSCTIGKSVTDRYNLIKVCVNSVDCISAGNPLFSTGGDFQLCGIAGVKSNGDYPSCVTTEMSANSKSYTILTVSKQRVRRVS
ncbi:hypothetical protein KW805_02670 [Candidatus Pacearchaeota archaeon]|nr:hypothetical protein [Candidatus Pacearchaeota archaeon]